MVQGGTESIVVECGGDQWAVLIRVCVCVHCVLVFFSCVDFVLVLGGPSICAASLLLSNSAAVRLGDAIHPTRRRRELTPQPRLE